MWLFPAHLFLFLRFLSGCTTAEDAITGPNEVTGLEGDSLTVQCPYASSWKTYKKYWCRGAAWGSCQTMISTDKSEQEVKKDRVSIRDDQETFVLTVTMEDLRRDDADTYWCVIERTGADHKAEVKVTIDPAPENSIIVTTTTATSLTSTPLTTEKTTSNHLGTPATPLTRSLPNSIYFLLLVFLELPLLLSMLGAVLWVNRPQRCRGGRRSRPDESRELGSP